MTPRRPWDRTTIYDCPNADCGFTVTRHAPAYPENWPWCVKHDCRCVRRRRSRAPARRATETPAACTVRIVVTGPVRLVVQQPPPGGAQ